MMPTFLRRLIARIKYRHFQRDLEQELAAHRAMVEDDLRTRGLSPEDAKPAAALALGNVTYMREEARSVWIARWLEQLWQDVRYALVMFRRRRAFSIGAMSILGLGLGLLATVAAFADAAFYRPWPVPNPETLRFVRSAASLGTDFRAVSVPEFLHLRQHTTSLRHMAMTVRGGAAVVQFPVSSERVPLMQVTSGYFEAVGARFEAGRPFLPEEDSAIAAPNVVVISERLWTDHFDRSPAAVGSIVRLGNTPMTIVGVVSDSFLDGHSSRTELWRPVPLAARSDVRHQDFPHSIIARLAPGVSVAQASQELERLSAGFRGEHGLPPITFRLPDTRPTGSSETKTVVGLVFVALVLVQLVACANVGNLMLAHAVARGRELAVRLCLGASRGRLMRQMLTEAALIATGAALLATAIVWLTPQIATASIPDLGERAEYYSPRPIVLAIAFLLTMTTALVSGLAPALKGTRVNLATASAGHGPTRQVSRMSSLLLAGQIAMATVLIVCASLLTRAVDRASGLDPGFDVDAVQQIALTFPTAIPRAEHESLTLRWVAAVRDAGLPAVALSNSAPVEDDSYGDPLRSDVNAPLRVVAAKNVTENYFEVVGIPLVAGRGPRPGGAGREVVLSKSFAEELWPGESPLGRTVMSGTRSDRSVEKTIVGIAPDLPVRSLAGTQPVAYSGTENGGLRVALIRSNDRTIIEQLSRVLHATAPGATLSARPLRDSLRASLSTAEIGGWVAWAIGALALALATVGAAGAFANAVEERRREIGVRMALGARATDVIRAVLMTTQRPLLFGLLVGMVAAQLASSFLRTYMYGLSSFDPSAHAYVIGVLSVAAVVASWIPAVRATRVNPLETLKQE